MKNEKPIAIVPAKGESMRVPGKNMERLYGHPMFLYSVWYAMNEGFDPVVSSDSEEILECARYFGARTFTENVDDSDIANCVRQVLEDGDNGSCELFALLQPTSPLRQPGLLREMAYTVSAGGGSASCAFTATGVKLLGSMVHVYREGVEPVPNKFYMAYRDQDADRKFMAFNGNILVCRKSAFDKSGNLFNNGDGALVYNSTAETCTTLQVDYPMDMALMEGAMCRPEFHDYNPANNLPEEYRQRYLWTISGTTMHA